MENARGEDGVGLAAPPVEVAVKIFFLAVKFTRGSAETYTRAVDSFHHAAPAGFGTAKAFQHTVKPFHRAVKSFCGTVKSSGGAVK